jgi:asparagine synthase (glutamine-hydrolysing)
MCGIFGTINARIEPMLGSLNHRGPDTNASMAYVRKQNGVLFGHNLLAIRGHQPQPIESERYMMTYNGEIYNATGNDAVWLLSMIDKHGVEGCLTHLTGMFAFAVWDKVESKLHLVVDRLGEKPLYYYWDGHSFAFASSPNALLHLQDKWEIDQDALRSYWKLGAVMEDSIWKGIKRVYASEQVVYDHGTITTTRYWQPSYITNTEGIGDLIRQSIDNVKVADVPVYIFLSGGIDSTLVASRFTGGHAIHLDGPERSWAEAVAKRYGITLHVVSPRTVDPIAALTDYVLKCGEPTMAGIIPWIVSEAASDLCRVAVTANGADELFFGYDRTTQDITAAQCRHIFRRGGEVKLPDIDERLSKGRWLELMTYVQHDLNRTLDFASMAHSLEVRSPYLNHELVEMALSMTPQQIGRKETLKKMLRADGWNNAFLNRAKMGFSLYEEPAGLAKFSLDASAWCRREGWLTSLPMGGRDWDYTLAAALGFKVWYETFKHKIV